MSAGGWNHLFHRGTKKWIVENHNRGHSAPKIQSNISECTIVAMDKAIHEFNVRRVYFPFIQTLIHLHIFLAALFDKLFNFLDF